MPIDYNNMLITPQDLWPRQSKTDRLLLPAMFWHRLRQQQLEIQRIHMSAVESIVHYSRQFSEAHSEGSAYMLSSVAVALGSYTPPFALQQSERGVSEPTSPITVPWFYGINDLHQLLTVLRMPYGDVTVGYPGESEQGRELRVSDPANFYVRLKVLRYYQLDPNKKLNPCFFCNAIVDWSRDVSYGLFAKQVVMPVCDNCYVLSRGSCYWLPCPLNKDSLYSDIPGQFYRAASSNQPEA